MKVIEFKKNEIEQIAKGYKLQIRIPVELTQTAYKVDDIVSILEAETGTKSNVSIRITDVLIKDLHNINNLDILASGFEMYEEIKNINPLELDKWFLKKATTTIKPFKAEWNNIYENSQFEWDNNPKVYVYYFEPV
ncbi:MAG: hypothetical protein FWF57_04210 [Defluviitaleaceae bacterium]|nr:hypothetical protein [Defluviitaleaceae bacterium]